MLFPSNMIGNANFKTNFLHKLLLNNIKFATFENLKLSKTQMPKIIESGESLGKLLGLLMKVGFPLINFHCNYHKAPLPDVITINSSSISTSL